MPKVFVIDSDNGKKAFAREVSGLCLIVDIDDVDHVAAVATLRKAFAILNYYWDSPMWEHAGKVPDDLQWADEEGEAEDEKYKRRDAFYRETMKSLRGEG